MKKLLVFIALFLFVPLLPAAAGELRENEVINIGVIVNRDNSIEIFASTTEPQFVKSAISIYADGDTPGEVRPIYRFSIGGNTPHIIWEEAREILKPGRYFAVVGSEFSYDLGVARAYFTIPAIEQWWTPQPTATQAPTPTEPTLSKTPKPTVKKTVAPVKAGTPAPTSSPGSSSVQIAAYIALGAIICVEFAIILYLLKKKK